MKRAVIAIAVFASSAATAKSYQPECHNEAVKAAVMSNYKKFGAGTNSCGLKALHLGEQLETYIACTSDETDPMEHIVVMEKVRSGRNGKITGRCVVGFVDVLTDAQHPNFESEQGLIETVECTIDSSDEKLICK